MLRLNDLLQLREELALDGVGRFPVVLLGLVEGLVRGGAFDP